MKKITLVFDDETFKIKLKTAKSLNAINGKIKLETMTVPVFLNFVETLRDGDFEIEMESIDDSN
jgi:hypothetical protein